ncbi:MAG: exonuclease subunit SbcD [Acidobacteria bacterium]|nr:MAG: exonuclease subunit SbcD [Acidobacteriota bacterium]
MRLLHISDLHAGKKLYDRISRNEDLNYALEQVVRICKEERVDLLLVAGDIFDKRNPDHGSQELIMDFLTRVNSIGLHTVLIAGNHDSYDFMRVYKHLRKLGNIHVFDRPLKNLRECIFELGELKVACLPYPDERAITHLSEDTQRSYAHKVGNYIRALAQEVHGASYKILMAHLMVEKAQITGSELQSSVSPFYAVKPESIPEEFTYVALGHVHKNQRIEGATPKVYYSGSLYQIDFSEKGMKKFVNLVILEDGLARVEPIELSLRRELFEVHIKPEDRLEEVLPKRNDVLLKIVLYMKMGDVLHHQKKEILQKELGDRLAKVEIELLEEKTLSVEERGDRPDLIDLYRDYYQKTYKTQPSKEIEELFTTLMDRAQHEAD